MTGQGGAGMRLVDAHCHLECEEFRGCLDGVLRDARAAGVVKMVTASVVPGDWPRSLELARLHGDVECVLGIHPWYCDENSVGSLAGLPEVLEKGAVGVGETGLDTRTDRTPFDLQVRVFEAQLSTARSMNLPVVLHCRGAFNEMLQSFKHVGVPERGGVVHNFTGSAETARQFMDFGMRFSLGGVLTHRNSRKRNEMLRVIYPDAMLLETDSPDIPPVEARERPNVPANIFHNLRAAAELLELPEAEIAAATTRNAARLFGWGA